MLNLLRKIYSGITHYKQKKKWDTDSRPFKKSLYKQYPLDLRQRALVIAPHADDELIGCHTFMKKINTTVCLCSMTGGNHSQENRLLRTNEFEKYCQRNQLPYVVLDAEHLSEELYRQIKTMKPDVIAIPSFVDWHPEHRKVNLILYDILREIEIKPLIIWYQISVPMKSEFVNYIQTMSRDEHHNKWCEFEQFYPSQQNINVFRFKYIEKRFVENNYAGERFCVIEHCMWLEYLHRLESMEEDLDKIKTHLGDVGSLLTKSNEYYSILSDKGKIQQ